MTYSSWMFFLGILLIAICSDLLIPVVLGRYYPGYNHLVDTISTLGTPGSPVQRYACMTLIGVGILLLLFTYGQARAFHSMTWCHILFILGTSLFGIGTVLAGICPETQPGTPETAPGKIHGIASGIGFLFLIFNPLWALWIQEFSKLRFVNGLLFPPAIMTFVLFLVSEHRTTGMLRYTGLFQRLNLLILYGHLFFNYLWQMKKL
ncbi:MAG: DUF998 domain-containing protein [Deltaproteobacteria bacterium]|nr:DUF998 domain-containing protein [Deltaproteobacteria bacterium]